MTRLARLRRQLGQLTVAYNTARDAYWRARKRKYGLLRVELYSTSTARAYQQVAAAWRAGEAELEVERRRLRAKAHA